MIPKLSVAYNAARTYLTNGWTIASEKLNSADQKVQDFADQLWEAKIFESPLCRTFAQLKPDLPAIPAAPCYGIARLFQLVYRAPTHPDQTLTTDQQDRVKAVAQEVSNQFASCKIVQGTNLTIANGNLQATLEEMIKTPADDRGLKELYLAYRNFLLGWGAIYLGTTFLLPKIFHSVAHFSLVDGYQILTYPFTDQTATLLGTLKTTALAVSFPPLFMGMIPLGLFLSYKASDWKAKVLAYKSHPFFGGKEKFTEDQINTIANVFENAYQTVEINNGNMETFKNNLKQIALQPPKKAPTIPLPQPNTAPVVAPATTVAKGKAAAAPTAPETGSADPAAATAASAAASAKAPALSPTLQSVKNRLDQIWQAVVEKVTDEKQRTASFLSSCPGDELLITCLAAHKTIRGRNFSLIKTFEACGHPLEKNSDTYKSLKDKLKTPDPAAEAAAPKPPATPPRPSKDS